MKKSLLFSSLISIGLIFTACIEKNIVTSNPQPAVVQTHTPSPSPVSAPVSMPPKRISIAPSTQGEYHELKTVQGSMLAIQERSNGFVFPQYKNKIVILQIFGEDCPSCLREVPIISSLRQKYANKVQVIALHAQDNMSPQMASRTIQRFQMHYPVVDKDENINLLHFIQKTYGWTGILPYMLVVKNGVTEQSFSGEVSHQELKEAIRDLI